MRRGSTVDDRRMWVFGLIIVLFCIVLVRLIFIQVVRAEEYSQKALDMRTQTIPLLPKRGTIYDRNGNELAVTLEASRIVANPRILEDKQTAAADLAPMIAVTSDALLSLLNKDSGYVVIKRNASRDVGNAVKEYAKKKRINGIIVENIKSRYYPYGTLGAPTIGFAASNGRGRQGLEANYEGLLGGKEGFIRSELDSKARPIPNGVEELVQPIDGSNIYLTLDRDIQYETEAALLRLKEKFGYKRAFALVMDPNTGEILAVAQQPTFDPNHFSDHKFEETGNFALKDAFEPGSIFKTVVAAGALEEKVAKPTDSYFLPSNVRVGGFTIGEAHPRPAGNFTFEEIITESSNIGAYTLAQKLGKQKYSGYIKKFGFGQPTGIDFLYDPAGQVLNVDDWSKPSLATFSFGHGLTVSSVQLASLYAAMANGGMRVNPHFLKEARAQNGKVVKKEVSPSDVRMMSETTAIQMKKILAAVVEKGTGAEAQMDNYTSGGKTGTARKVVGGKYVSRYVSSFIGFAPVEDPQIVVAVVVDEPEKARYGGVVAAPYFKEIAEYSLQSLNVLPDKDPSESADNKDGPAPSVKD